MSGFKPIVHVDLHQDGNIDTDLHNPAHPELHRGHLHNEVNCLESITTCPHNDHFDAGEKEPMKVTDRDSVRWNGFVVLVQYYGHRMLTP